MSTPSPYKKPTNVTQMIVGGSRDQTVTQMTSGVNDPASRDAMAATNRDPSAAAATSREQSSLPLPDEREMDWTTLVNTATKAICVKGSDAEVASTKIDDLEDEEIEIAQRFLFEALLWWHNS